MGKAFGSGSAAGPAPTRPAGATGRNEASTGRAKRRKKESVLTKILHLIKGLGRGGAERLVANSVRHLDRSRFDVEVAYLLPWKDALVPEIEGAGVTTHCLGIGGGLEWVARLRRLVGDRGIDLLHGHSPYPMVGARLAVPRRCPLVYTEHNVWERYDRPTYWANLLTYARNAHVFAVSDEVRRSARYPAPLGFLPMPPIETLYHGPDREALSRIDASDGVLEELGIAEGSPVVGTIGNLKEHKGHEDLLRAATIVRRDVPEARFVVIGQGPQEGSLRRQAGELGLDGTVVFAGYREDALRVAATFDVFVMSSLHEGLSIALLEAMALGKPSVITRVGGLPEVVRDEEDGLIVPPRDPDALAGGILRLLRDPSARSKLGAAARLRAATFDIRTAVQRMESVYEELAR
jgi:glycosyltransferase involved in cell wall biosynthesis